MKKNKFIKEKHNHKNTFYFKKNLSNKFLNNLDLSFIKKYPKSRICIHENINSKIHEMIIFHEKGTYVEPHFHNKSESLLIISGKMEVKIYNSTGEVIDSIILSQYNKSKLNKIFLYKFEKHVIHSQFFLEDSIFKEVSSGPFKSNNTMKAKFKNL